MHRCEDCKIILDNDVRHCPKCGKEIGSDTDSAPEPIMDVPRLLAAASLHKFRSEWDEAISAATDALRLEPRNPDVTLALGSIYEEQGLLDEALIWYQMTLELDEESKQGKAGRDRVQMLSAARRKEAEASPKKTTNRSLIYAIGIGAAVVFVAILIAWSAVHGHRARNTSALPSSDRRTSLEPPISQPWARRPSSAPSNPAPPLSGATATPSAQTTAPSLRTKAEQTIKDGLSSAQPVTEAGAAIDDVIADPRAAVVTVTFSVPVKGMVTKDQISKAAVAVARQTFALHQAVKFVTARCVVQIGTEGGQVAFVGDIARESVTPTATDQQLAAAFSHPWWNPQIGNAGNRE